MKTTQAQWQLYKRLELIPDSVEQPKSGLAGMAERFVSSLGRFLGNSNDVKEPDIWQTLDRHGNLWWHAYDPATGKTSYLSSEEEVLMWLDQRHSFS